MATEPSRPTSRPSGIASETYRLSLCSHTLGRRAWKFTRATLAHDAAADEYREAIVKRWGRRALVSVAFSITAARIYPTVKYALGHGKSCMRVTVAGTPVMFDHGRVPAPADK